MSPNAVELLAPAGNMECLHAAVCGGANAVYLGLDEFNARRNADNFTLDTLKDACRYAHLRNVAVYVAMNTQIMPGELDRALELAQLAWNQGADAVIVQDIGLASALHGLAPHIPIHTSTQMNIHNAAGMEFAAALGATRVTLSRELSLGEIEALAEIGDALGIEVESFIHGALCVCYSGQCLMSSMIGGRSANRGLCAQPCRLPYELWRADHNDAVSDMGDYALSPKDLCSAPLIPELIKAGVCSFKIEGRMKSADYVYTAVSVYREIIDGATVSEKHITRLEDAFSRGFTTAYLEGKRGNEIMGYQRPNNRGVFIGRVATAKDEIVEVVPELPMNSGDVLEFWTSRGNVTAKVANDVNEGQLLRVSVEGSVRKGDRVFRVRSAANAFQDEPNAPRIPITAEVLLHRGQPAHMIVRDAQGMEAESWGAPVEPARTKALSEDEVIEHIGRMGQTPFCICEESDLSVSLDEGVGMSFSSLHRLRTDALEALEHEILSTWEHAEIDVMYLENANRRPRKAARNPLVCAWVTSPATARAAKHAGAGELYVPLLNFRRGQALSGGVISDITEQAGYPKECIMALPVIDHDAEGNAREAKSNFDMWDYVRTGKPIFADNIGDAWRALTIDATVEVGQHIPATNRATLDFLEKIGVSRVWLSPELTLGQIAELAETTTISLGIFVSGAQELMVTEHCALMAQGACNQACESCERRGVAHHLHDRKGFDFPVVTDMYGRSHIYNGVEFDGIPTLCDFMSIGLSAFMIDTTLWDKKTIEAAIKRAVRGVESCNTSGKPLDKRPGTTTGHLFRGVQ